MATGDGSENRPFLCDVGERRVDVALITELDYTRTEVFDRRGQLNARERRPTRMAHIHPLETGTVASSGYQSCKSVCVNVSVTAC